ncbi:hypothetical protein J2X68_003212 [Streptomyces sp. 3330]|uniref:DUF5615 family PIN-like protein n=1 Tax=Streptomyces sp. 3330 TaxID=2817755 RepID=UPI00285B26E5|nr:DUF5615 family PIN-like protein [Streptomyces sp. 3330]MDR6976521.1 hypothetical protein [Streptomyces sp. 3330]
MKLLLDENVPRPMAEIVRILLKAHEVVHVHELKGWTGTKDIELYVKAKADGFEVVITNDTKQLSRPLEVAAIAQSGLHRIECRQNNKHGGLVGLGTAIATVCAALPHALSELEAADGQRLVSLTSIDPTRQKRLQITDPAVAPPKHWPGRDSTAKS